MQGVYFIHAPELTQVSLFKIGWSIDIDRRLTQLQTGNGMALEIYATIPTNDQSIEKRIHKALFKYRTRGEWFQIITDQVDVICAMITEFVELDIEDGEYVPESEESEEPTEEYDIEDKDNIAVESDEDVPDDEIKDAVAKPKKIKSFICKKCNRGFKEQHHLENHNRRKTPCNIKHECPKCHKLFISKTSLKKHKDLVIPCMIDKMLPNINNKIECICLICNKKFTDTSSLQRHQLDECIETARQMIDYNYLLASVNLEKIYELKAQLDEKQQKINNLYFHVSMQVKQICGLKSQLNLTLSDSLQLKKIDELQSLLDEKCQTIENLTLHVNINLKKIDELQSLLDEKCLTIESLTLHVNRNLKK